MEKSIEQSNVFSDVEYFQLFQIRLFVIDICLKKKYPECILLHLSSLLGK